MTCQIHELPHILNGIYLNDATRLLTEQAASQNIHIFLIIGEKHIVDGGRTYHLELDDELTEQQLREGAAFLNRQVSVGERVVIYSSEKLACSVMVVLAYLIEYEGMDLANAYTLVAQSSYLIRLSAACFIPLMRAYGLPYKERDVQDNYFTSYLVSWVRENLSRVYRGVHVGGITALERQTRTREKGIEAVLRLDDSRRIGFNWSDQFVLHDMPLSDGIEVSGKSLDQGASFIAEQVSMGRNVLVHCEMGVSRSVTMVLAYLICYEKMTLPQAYATVIKRRAIAHPHPRLLASLVGHFKLPYTLEQALDLDFHNCLLLEAHRHAGSGA